jgi:hypothetical protein
MCMSFSRQAASARVAWPIPEYHTSETDAKNQAGARATEIAPRSCCHFPESGPFFLAPSSWMSPSYPSASRVPLSAGAAGRCFEIAKIGTIPLAPRCDQVPWIGGGIQRGDTLG